MSYSSSSGQSQPVFHTDPGLYGEAEDPYGESRRLGGQLESVINAPAPSPISALPELPGLGPAASSVYSSPLEGALLRPSYNPDTASEQALINSIMDVTAGRGAVRGLGAPTYDALAQAVAPTLVDLRNTDIQNLMGAYSTDTNRILGERGQDISLRAQDLERMLGLQEGQLMQRAQDIGLRQSDIEALLNLIGLAMPQTIGGQTSTETSSGFGLV